MFKSLLIRSIILSLVFTNTVNLTQAAYHPEVKGIIESLDTQINALKTNNASTNAPQLDLNYNNNGDGLDSDISGSSCATQDWTSFQKSFGSYGSFMGDWKDIIRNDCLREDIWELEDKKSYINSVAVSEASRCNPNLPEFKAIYETIDQYIAGLRRYGEDAQLESSEGGVQACPNCEKAEIVGEENVNFNFASNYYEESVCPLTKDKSKDFKTAWDELVQNMQMFKNVKKMWQTGTSDFSANFTAEDYAAAEKNSSSWWDRSWEEFYGYNGGSLTFRHLRDGEDSMLEPERSSSILGKALKAVGNVLKPPTIEELAKEHDLQLEIYSNLAKGEQLAAEQKILAELSSQLQYDYRLRYDIGADLENYLIDINNSVKGTVSPIENFTIKLRDMVSRQCANLYGKCKE